jgi:hypothetical protein
MPPKRPSHVERRHPSTRRLTLKVEARINPRKNDHMRTGLFWRSQERALANVKMAVRIPIPTARTNCQEMRSSKPRNLKVKKSWMLFKSKDLMASINSS